MKQININNSKQNKKAYRLQNSRSHAPNPLYHIKLPIQTSSITYTVNTKGLFYFV